MIYDLIDANTTMIRQPRVHTGKNTCLQLYRAVSSPRYMKIILSCTKCPTSRLIYSLHFHFKTNRLAHTDESSIRELTNLKTTLTIRNKLKVSVWGHHESQVIFPCSTVCEVCGVQWCCICFLINSTSYA